MWLAVVADGWPGAPGWPMTSTVIATLICRSARPGSSDTAATTLMLPWVSWPGVIVTVEPPLVTVAPDGRLTPRTWMSGWASGLVTYCLRSTVTLCPASVETLTARPAGQRRREDADVEHSPGGRAGRGDARLPVAPGLALLAADSSSPVPPVTLAATPPGCATQPTL